MQSTFSKKLAPTTHVKSLQRLKAAYGGRNYENAQVSQNDVLIWPKPNPGPGLHKELDDLEVMEGELQKLNLSR